MEPPPTQAGDPWRPCCGAEVGRIVRRGGRVSLVFGGLTITGGVDGIVCPECGRAVTWYEDRRGDTIPAYLAARLAAAERERDSLAAALALVGEMARERRER